MNDIPSLTDPPTTGLGCDHCLVLTLASNCRACLCAREPRAHIVCRGCIVTDLVPEQQLGDLLLEVA